MGLYDRDYVRDDDTPQMPLVAHLRGKSPVLLLVWANALVFLLDLFLPTSRGALGWLAQHMALDLDSIRQPWYVWQLVTYGFAHGGLNHLAFNMLGLWSFGQAIEARYGSREFTRFYFTSLIVAGAVWLAKSAFTGVVTPVIGASGAVNALAILFAWNYPWSTIRVMFVLPMPAWVAAVLFVLIDMGGFGHGIAHEVHLGGAAFATLYFWFGWRLERWLPPSWFTSLTMRRQRFRVFQEPDPAEVEARVDAILQKISEQGEASLTRAERKALEEASRRYQRRKPL